MELVKGVPITKFCDERKLTPRERLELFLPVCHAIQHAHQKGIIHRDLKPTNVLVALYDGQPVPKVIDFGVAKAAGLPLTELTLVTGFGALVGTPEYMSPEQAQLNQLDIDTRSDIYGLGVLLYELLSGTTPLTRQRMKVAALLEVLRVIREEEPQKPSTRLSTTDELASIAANRGTEPARLSRLVRGELDWIVMKSLEKDRARRYDTAGEFAADVRRYLADEPVQACPPSSWYRFRKFARRKRGLLVATSLVSLALVSGIIGTTWARIDARSQRNLARAREEQARSAEAEANAVLQFFERRILSATRPKGQGWGLGREAKIGDAVDNAEPAIAEAFADKPLAEASIRRALGLTYWYMGDYAKAIAQHERALALRRAHLGSEHPDTLNSMTNLGQAYQSAGRLTDALPIYEETLKLRKALIGPTDTETLWTMNRLAGTLVSLGRTEEALPIYEEALSIARTTLGPDHTDTLIYLDKLAEGYRYAGRLAESLQLFEEALRLYEAKLPPEHPDRLATMGNVALVRCDFGRWAEAIPMLQKALELKRGALGPTHPETLIGLHNLGVAHRDFGQTAEALPILEEAVKLHTARMGADHHLTLIMAFNLAWLYRDTGRLEEALALFQETLRLQLVKLSADHPRRLLVMNHTGDCLMRMKKYTEADTLLRECLALRTRKAPGEWWVSQTKSQLGRVATSLKQHAEAESLLLEAHRELLASQDKLPTRHRPYVGDAAQGLVNLYDAMGNKDQAAEWRKKLEAHRKEFGKDQKSKK